MASRNRRRATARSKAARKHKIAKAQRRVASLLKKKRNGHLTST